MVGINGALCLRSRRAALSPAPRDVKKDWRHHVSARQGHRTRTDGRYQRALLGGDYGTTVGCARTASPWEHRRERPARRACSGCRATCWNGNLRKGATWPAVPDGYERDRRRVNRGDLGSRTRPWFKGRQETWRRGPKIVRSRAYRPEDPRIRDGESQGLPQDGRRLEDRLQPQRPDRIPIGGGGVPSIRLHRAGQGQAGRVRQPWFARSRESADDYSRLARQKCV